MLVKQGGSVTLASELQWENAESPMLVTFGIDALASELQPENAE